MEIRVYAGTSERVLHCASGENLLSVLQRNGYHITAPCGGTGRCGKCRVRILAGQAEGEKDGYVIACRTTVTEDLTVEVQEATGGGLTASGGAVGGTDGETGYGVALDIGTTTLAFSLVNLRSGEEPAREGFLNRQGVYGADVISRIVSAGEGHLQEMQSCILQQTREVLRDFIARYHTGPLRRLSVCGNTTMLHLFLGADVDGIGKYPFRASFLHTVRRRGADLCLPVEEVVLLPSVSAYVGADIVAGGLSAGIRQGCNLLVDIGTNGEMLLHAGGRLYATSTAAGPCFEGANISCGMGGVAGAIDHVREGENGPVCSVIGGGPARGICGSGLIDAVALMRRQGIVDETGAFVDPGQERYPLCDRVYISDRDIRAFQLAKSAICAGISVLLQQAGLRYEEVDHLYIAGGLGFYLDRGNAMAVGLLPRALGGRTEVVGNTALSGTVLCLCRAQMLNEAAKLAEETTYVDLSVLPEFMDAYMENMQIGEENA